MGSDEAHQAYIKRILCHVQDLDTGFVFASFFALLLFQDEYNKVHDSQDACVGIGLSMKKFLN